MLKAKAIIEEYGSLHSKPPSPLCTHQDRVLNVKPLTHQA